MSTSRRSFLKTLGLTGVALATCPMAAARVFKKQAQPLKLHPLVGTSMVYSHGTPSKFLMSLTVVHCGPSLACPGIWHMVWRTDTGREFSTWPRVEPTIENFHKLAGQCGDV